MEIVQAWHPVLFLSRRLGWFRVGRLKELGVTLPYAPQDGAYNLYSGDASVPGKGEILVWDWLSAWS
ncbi:MAG TPA: hypothetical protein VMM76_02905 [Pirellulaceae bacterium]|nr:hypothetical protein [Pirellulaceae bacterium]